MSLKRMPSFDAAKKALGREGEELAANFLLKKGYTILAVNVVISVYGEIDIIANDRSGALVFIEVKTRRNLSGNTASEALSESKIERLFAAIEHYCDSENIDSETTRLDFIAVEKRATGWHIEHYQSISPE